MMSKFHLPASGKGSKFSPMFYLFYVVYLSGCTKTLDWNTAIVDVISNTRALPTMT